jgi:hypothetical protein
MTKLSDIAVPYTVCRVIEGRDRPDDFIAELIKMETRDAACQLGEALLFAKLAELNVTAWHPDPNVRHRALRSPTQTALELRARVVRPGRDLGDYVQEQRRMAVQEYAMKTQGMSELHAAIVSQRFVDLAKDNPHG